MLKTSFLTIIPRNFTDDFLDRPFGGSNIDRLKFPPSLWDAYDEFTKLLPSFNKRYETVFGADGAVGGWDLNFDEKTKKYSVEIELPRFRKENIRIEQRGIYLDVSAEQDSLKFYKTFHLPSDHNGNIDANLDHGVLTVSVGWEQPKSIQIHDSLPIPEKQNNLSTPEV